MVLMAFLQQAPTTVNVHDTTQKRTPRSTYFTLILAVSLVDVWLVVGRQRGVTHYHHPAMSE